MSATLPTDVQIENVRLYLKVKWAILGFLAAVMALENILGVSFVSGLVNYIAVSFLVVSGAALEWSIRSKRMLTVLTALSLLLDIAVIVLVIYLHGGMEDTWLFFPVFVIFFSSYIFGISAGIAYAALAYICVLSMSLFQYFGLIPYFPQFDLPVEHWRNFEYLIDYMLGMLLLYGASAAAMGLLNQLAAQSAKKVEEYRQKLKEASISEADAKEKIRQARVEIMVKNAELERLQGVSAERQMTLVELKRELEEIRRRK